MKKLTLVPAILSFVAFPALAAPEFSEVDADQDGVLSITEAQDALSDLLIVDANMDGLLNAAEIESAVPGLALNALEPETATIGEYEYELIVQAMEAGMEEQS